MVNNFTISALIQIDTLSKSYAEKWKGAEAGADGFIGFMSSNELVFVVLGVSLIIWFILLFFIIRLDKKITNLEQKTENNTPHL